MPALRLGMRMVKAAWVGDDRGGEWPSYFVAEDKGGQAEGRVVHLPSEVGDGSLVRLRASSREASGPSVQGNRSSVGIHSASVEVHR